MRNHSNDEITSIRAELCQLEDISREISYKRVALLRRLDSLQSSTSVLPPEALSLIFLHAILPHEIIHIDCLPRGVRPRDGPLSPLFLGSISHTWRQVAWSTPQLWTKLSLFIAADKVKKLPPLLDLYLANVRGLPIALHLAFDYHYTLNPQDDPVARVFFKEENVRKLGTLELCWPPASWLHHSDGLFSQLVKIHLAGRHGPPLLVDTPFLTNAPALKEISLKYTQVPLKVPWSLITTLKLEDVSAVMALRCLLESPNLVEFRYVYATPNGQYQDDGDREYEEPPELPNVVTFYHLEVLQWSFKLNRASDLFLRRIRLPALRSLTWDQRGRPLTDPHISGILSFFRNLACAPLINLHLRGVFYMYIDLAKYINFTKHIYHENSQIESLLFEDCNEDTLCIALASLIPGWGGRGLVDERRYLTKLKMMEVRGCVSDDDDGDPMAGFLGETFGDIVADLLIGRTGTDFISTLCINLVFGNLTEVRWWSETKQYLQEFSCAGMEVRLLEEGEQASWLKDDSQVTVKFKTDVLLVGPSAKLY